MDFSHITGLLPAVNREQVELRTALLEALQRISGDLIPGLRHPCAHEIAAGPDAYGDLLSRLDATEDEQEVALIVDTIREIARRWYATEEVIARLRGLVASPSDRVHYLATGALAFAEDEEFLKYQHELLWSTDLSVVARAIELLGWGRFEPAIPKLVGLLGPETMALQGFVITALGDMRSTEGLPALHAMLDAHTYIMRTCEALGKIGDPSSFERLLSVVALGTLDQRSRAARAISLLLLKHGMPADASLPARAESILAKAADEDPSLLTRYYALVACSHMGVPLGQNRIMKALGVELPKSQLSAMSAFFVGRAAN